MLIILPGASHPPFLVSTGENCLSKSEREIGINPEMVYFFHAVLMTDTESHSTAG